MSFKNIIKYLFLGASATYLFFNLNCCSYETKAYRKNNIKNNDNVIVLKYDEKALSSLEKEIDKTIKDYLNLIHSFEKETEKWIKSDLKAIKGLVKYKKILYNYLHNTEDELLKEIVKTRIEYLDESINDIYKWIYTSQARLKTDFGTARYSFYFDDFLEKWKPKEVNFIDEKDQETQMYLNSG